MPVTFDIVGTMDLVYKLHKIFAIEPHIHLKRWMDFLDYFVYGNDDAVDSGAINQVMHDLGDKLLQMSI